MESLICKPNALCKTSELVCSITGIYKEVSSPRIQKSFDTIAIYLRRSYVPQHNARFDLFTFYFQSFEAAEILISKLFTIEKDALN